MNHLFQDQEQNVFIKVLSSQDKASRELMGAAVFSQFVEVPASSALDSKVILVNKMLGSTSDMIPNTVLNTKVLELLIRINREFTGNVIAEFSLGKLIEELILKCAQDQKLLKLLTAAKLKLSRAKHVPVHGDLQKRNILFSPSGNMTLIDFEHFCFAPAELELANSLFHQDANCLDVEFLIPRLVKARTISLPILSDMLTLYTLKEMSQGLNKGQAFKMMQSGLRRLNKIVCLERSKPDSVLQQLSV